MTGKKGWRHILFEDLLQRREHIFAKHTAMGYQDFKHILIADPGAPPLHLHIEVKEYGPVSLIYYYALFFKIDETLNRINPFVSSTSFFVYLIVNVNAKINVDIIIHLCYINYIFV